MPQESLLALGAIVTIVIAAVAFLEGSTAAERDDGDRLGDSIRTLFEETGALAAARAVSSLLANRPVRQARRPRSTPGRSASLAPATSSMAATSVASLVAAPPPSGVDDVATEVWSQAAMANSNGKPTTQPNRIIVSSVRSRGRSLRRGPGEAPIAATARPRVDESRRATRPPRSLSLRRVGLLQVLTAILVVALVVLVAILLFRPEGDAGVLSATSAPTYGAGAALPTATPSPSLPSPSPSPTPPRSPAPTATATPKPSPTPTPTPRKTPTPAATLTPHKSSAPASAPPPAVTRSRPTPTPTPKPTPKPTPRPTPTPDPTPTPLPLPSIVPSVPSLVPLPD
jgi:hypothetical protein